MMPNRRSFVRNTLATLAAARLSTVAYADKSLSGHSRTTPGAQFPYFLSTPVSARHVALRDQFWAPRQRTTREVSIAWVSGAHDRAGGLKAFRTQQSKYRADPSVVNMEAIKCIEAMAAVVGVERDKDIEGLIDAWTKPMLAAQGADGYLQENFPPGLERPPRRWQPVWWSHESYAIGHYIESALAYREVCGENSMYTSALRAADNMVVDLLGRNRSYASAHPGIEQALMRLFGETGERKYLELCGWLIEQRGRHEGRPNFGRAYLDHLPVKDQRTIEGHAVMAGYLFNGVTMFVGATGNSHYRKATLSVWDDFVNRKMFIHGGGGNISSKIEGYRKNPYCILPDDAYCESCSVVANFQWAHNLFRLTGDAQYLDAAERMIYNAFYASLSLSGDSSFYCNVIQTDNATPRSTTLAASCCPPNIIKLFNQIGGYFYSTDSDGLFVKHYGTSTAEIPWRSGLRLVQETMFPWTGEITIRVEPSAPERFQLRLRIPQWVSFYAIYVNDARQRISPKDGWLTIDRIWQIGDVVALTLDMPVKRIKMPPEFEEYQDRVAVQRGPIVYCLEEQDIGDSQSVHSSSRESDSKPLTALYIPEDAKFTVAHRPDLLGGATVLTCDLRQLHWKSDDESVVRVTLIPYGLWNNRTPGPMRVWLGARKLPLVELLYPQLVNGDSCIG